jgi:hypothetical protein
LSENRSADRVDAIQIVRPFSQWVNTNVPFQFQKRSQLFIRAHNETLSVVAMCVCNEDRSPTRIHGCDAAPTPTGFAQIVRDDFPYFTTAALLIVQNRLRCRFAHLKLRADLLDLCSLLFHRCHESFDFPLLLGVVRF